jgi:predicted nuclease of predicted toxin-antitoxin system
LFGLCFGCNFKRINFGIVMLIIADENIPRSITESLRLLEVEVIYIYDEFRGIDDFSIINLAKQKTNAIILTEDKDFDEWIFSHHMTGISVIFLRYHFSELSEITNVLIKLISEKQNNLLNKFITVTPTKIRMRDLF